MYLSQKRLNEIFANLKNTKILVIGDIMLDRYVWGNCERISPEAPVPVIHVEGETERVGGAANVAINISSLGARPFILGQIGSDINGTKLKDKFADFNISSKYLIETKNRPTTVKTRVIAQNQQVVRVDREDPTEIKGETLLRMKDILEPAINEVDGVIISDYGKGVITTEFLEAILEIAKSKNKFISVDPKERHFSIYHEISLITPNAKETSYAVGYRVESNESVKKAGIELRDRLKCESVLITRGSMGMSLFTKEHEYYLPTMAQKVFDVTGAGDTVIATVSTACCAGATIKEASIIGNHAAGISVSELGTKAVTQEEIIKSMTNEHEKNNKS